MNRLAALAASLFLLLFVSGCAIAPAKVRRVMKAMPGVDSHTLLARALDDPDSVQGKLDLAHFIEHWKLSGLGQSGDVPPPKGESGITYRVTFPGMEQGADPIAYFDQIGAAADYEVKKLPHHVRDGVGAPLTALRENKHQQPVERYYPPEAITRPLTALATEGERQGSVQNVSIQLLCPLVNPEVSIDGRPQPLAGDFSVPWGALLARTGKLNQAGILDLLTPTPRRDPQLFLMEAYDPDKEPLVMIHGLLATPLTWAEISNELWADDAVRQRYQIWHYLYNTSAPPLYSARILRAQLRELRDLVDADRRHPASHRITLLTHSMGGLVGKSIAMNPGDAFWKAAFTVPPSQLKLSAEDRARLNDAFEWEPDHTVRRIIFISVPHRGSELADGFVGRIGARIASPPHEFQAFYDRISQENPDVFTPAYEKLGTGKLNSVRALSPNMPTLAILNTLPYAQPVKLHSIIGDRGKADPPELSSDGVVAYTSSHIEGVESEKIVPADHWTYRHPEAIREIVRILNLE